MKRLMLSLFVAGSVYSNIFAQFFAYGSVSYGYNQNPLYNYQNQGDQLKQTYLELNYMKDYDNSQLKFSYVSGLVLFNSFADRNYYEHNLFSRYSISFVKDKPQNEVKLINDENSEGVDENQTDQDSVRTIQAEDEEELASDDSTNSSLDLMAKVGARHDKELFKEFDNFGTNFLASYKFLASDAFTLRLTNDFGLRNYTYISELSNLTDIFTLQAANKFNGSYSFGVRLSAAYKYYTSTVYDTSKFETERTYKKKTGKGKGGAVVTVPSGKQILLQPQSNGTSQLTAGLFFIKSFVNSSMEVNLLYRYNPNTQTRYYAQQTNAGINEDIYNDFFSYQGYETGIKYNRQLFFGIQMSADINITKKNFEAPALDLNGAQTDLHRNDLNMSVDLFVSRSINIYRNFSVDLICGAGIVRNQSNDSYNDFSSYSVSGGIGIGL
ncbi:MAG: hypothetical protein ACM34K_17600 [Bacillota bacterium]